MYICSICKPILTDKPLDTRDLDQFLLHQLTQYVTFLNLLHVAISQPPNGKIHSFEMMKGKNQSRIMTYIDATVTENL